MFNFDYNPNNQDVKPKDILSAISDFAEQASEGSESKRTAYPFPIDAFPQIMQTIILELKASLSYPIDFTASAMISICSAAIGNTHKIKVRQGWIDNAIVYMVIVGEAGTMKSHPINFIAKPLLKKDNADYATYKKEKDAYEHYKGMHKKDLTDLELENMVRPVKKQIVINDATMEALVSIHSANPRGLILISDELAGWFKNFSRYSSGSDEEKWLSIFSSQPLMVDRKTSEPLRIPKPFVNVLGGIQPAILSSLAKQDRSENGFMDRLLFTMPEGLKAPRWSDTQLNPFIETEWHSIVNKLLDFQMLEDPSKEDNATLLKMTKEAAVQAKQWFNKNASISESSGDSQIKGLCAKLSTYFFRLALIIQMMKYASGEGTKDHIDLDSIQSAIKLVEYFRHMGMKIRDVLSNQSPVDLLPENQKTLYHNLPEEFKTSDIMVEGERLDISRSTVFRMLDKPKLFKRLRKGIYQKLYLT